MEEASGTKESTAPNDRADRSCTWDDRTSTVAIVVQYAEAVIIRHPSIVPCTIPSGLSRDVVFGLVNMIQSVLHDALLEALQFDRWSKVKVHVATVDVMGVSIN